MLWRIQYGTGGYGKYGFYPHSCGSGVYKLLFTVSYDPALDEARRVLRNRYIPTGWGDAGNGLRQQHALFQTILPKRDAGEDVCERDDGGSGIDRVENAVLSMFSSCWTSPSIFDREYSVAAVSNWWALLTRPISMLSFISTAGVIPSFIQVAT